MSWGDDNAYDIDFEDDYSDDSIFKRYLLGTLDWKCKDGRKINIKDMTTEHILNCKRIPTYSNKENWDIVFNYELKRRKL